MYSSVLLQSRGALDYHNTVKSTHSHTVRVPFLSFASRASRVMTRTTRECFQWQMNNVVEHEHGE